MTHTPIPTPIPQEIGVLIVCDGCLNHIRIEEGSLPLGWKKVYVYGWIGAFHACCGSCEEKIISARKTKSVSRSKIIIV